VSLAKDSGGLSSGRRVGLVSSRANGLEMMEREAEIVDDGAAVVVGLALVAPGAAAAGRLRIEVLSSRADLISGGQAVVAIDLPAGARPSGVRVKLGRRDVTSSSPYSRQLAVMDASQ
jgi:hypothetical protein